jgi:7-cyano-7-deazaguanine synthase
MSKPSSKKKAVVLLSGGMDSAVTLWWAISKGWTCQALSFDYGQRHKRELASARRLARRAGVPIEVVRIKMPWSRSALTDKRQHLPQRKLNTLSTGRLPPTYVPARNTIFLSLALSVADQQEAEAIVIGANAIDYSGYPDCRPAYLAAFERVARLGSRMGAELHRKIRILAPLVRLSKADIVRWGRRLGVPLEMSWSCYKGGRTPCGQCDSCQLRAKGFAEA